MRLPSPGSARQTPWPLAAGIALGLAGALGGCGAKAVELSPATSNIKHLVVIVQENHTFDDHFGRYCQAAAGSSPTCTDGPACCEAAPAREPGGASPVVLDDAEMAAYDPDHTRDCEAAEMNGGKMDRYVSGTACSSPHNFALAGDAVKAYWDYAARFALADRWFQPIIGQSSANDMYLARAGYVFTDNDYGPGGVTQRCAIQPKTMQYTDPTIADLLVARGATWAWYGEGYQEMTSSLSTLGLCPDPPSGCEVQIPLYPCTYDPSDVPFQYYKPFLDNPTYMKDYAALAGDLAAGALPQVSFVKGLGYHSEHPGLKTRLGDGVKFATAVVEAVLASRYADDTLVILTYDEGGGYFDHVAPPTAATVDGQPYGTRVPTLALGRFARKNHVSHVELEHSSIVRFIEWNWLDGKTGQLGTRDAVVHNLGDLLDPATTGVAVPN